MKILADTDMMLLVFECQKNVHAVEPVVTYVRDDFTKAHAPTSSIHS